MLLRFVPAWQDIPLCRHKNSGYDEKAFFFTPFCHLDTHIATDNQSGDKRGGTALNGWNHGYHSVRLTGFTSPSPSLFLLQVHYDGWSHVYDEWMDSDHPDIHPAGWCEATNHPLKVAPRDAKTHQPHGSNPHISVFVLQPNLEAGILTLKSYS